MVNTRLEPLLVVSAFIAGSTTGMEREVKCVMVGSETAVSVPQERINDDYCDCPWDGGIDESDTEACSGAPDGWAGVFPHRVEGSSPPSFPCPQQHSLILPSSRVHDRICDCCDGTDEAPGVCPDDCDVVLAEQRRLHAELQENFTVGYKQRREAQAAFAELLSEVEADVERIEGTQLKSIQGDIEVLKQRADKLDEKRILRKQQMLDEISSTGDESKLLGHLFGALSKQEIVDFIVAVCQVSGENPGAEKHVTPDEKEREYTPVLDSTVDEDSICLVLLKAAIDVGYVWKSSDDGSSWSRIDGERNTKNRSADKTKSRRRRTKKEKDTASDESYDENASVLAPYHHAFRQHAIALLDHIESIEKDSEDDEFFSEDEHHYDDYGFDSEDHGHPAGVEESVASEGEEAEEAEKVNGGEAMKTPSPAEASSVDPMAMRMARNELRDRLEHIERGNKYARTAKLMMGDFRKFAEKSLDDNAAEQDMRKLAVATLWHSQVSSADIALILYALLPEFNVAYKDAGSMNACGGDFNVDNFCPAQSVVREVREGLSVKIPPSAIVEAAEERCRNRSWRGDKTCAVDGESSLEVPTNVYDGYYGYYKFVARSDRKDPLSDVFSAICGKEDEELGLLRATISETQKREQALQKEIDALEEKIGGRDRKYGVDGVLYSLKDQCFKIEAGKYEYELCPFDQAWQRDIGQKGKGTNLGKWKGPSKDEETGDPILVFDKGQRCWQGTQRSSTVYVSCGAETQVVNAEEPETCQYAFELVSPIACDEHFAKDHGLKTT